MKILGFDKLSLVDYPGLTAAIIFAGGCNFRCPFCHNAGIVNQAEVEITEKEIFEYLIHRKSLIDSVCISGGEPTLYHDLPELIKKIKDLGYKVKLDTNGTNPDMLKNLIDENLIDYVAMDIKNGMSCYSKTAGCAVVLLEKVQKSIEILKQNCIDYEFRTTLVKTFHNASTIKEMGISIEGAKKLYLQKFVDNEHCLQSGLEEIDFKTAESFKSILTKYVDSVELRGY